jgi:2-C-methyl-D-erythritol 2,4-cyclodiphosphate synthase
MSNIPLLRVGLGYDVHAFAEGRPLILGGVEFPHHRGLDGHSDADVLLHAIADALLGAASLGDIGQHFPPGDPRFEGIASTLLLAQVAHLLKSAGWQIVNVDCTLVAERPKIGPCTRQMRQNIASALRISLECVGVQATTNEHLGFVGREEGMAALAVALLSRDPDQAAAPPAGGETENGETAP